MINSNDTLDILSIFETVAVDECMRTCEHAELDGGVLVCDHIGFYKNECGAIQTTCMRGKNEM